MPVRGKTTTQRRPMKRFRPIKSAQGNALKRRQQQRRADTHKRQQIISKKSEVHINVYLYPIKYIFNLPSCPRAFQITVFKNVPG